MAKKILNSVIFVLVFMASINTESAAPRAQRLYRTSKSLKNVMPLETPTMKAPTFFESLKQQSSQENENVTSNKSNFGRPQISSFEKLRFDEPKSQKNFETKKNSAWWIWLASAFGLEGYKALTEEEQKEFNELQELYYTSEYISEDFVRNLLAWVKNTRKESKKTALEKIKKLFQNNKKLVEIDKESYRDLVEVFGKDTLVEALYLQQIDFYLRMPNIIAEKMKPEKSDPMTNRKLSIHYFKNFARYSHDLIEFLAKTENLSIASPAKQKEIIEKIVTAWAADAKKIVEAKAVVISTQGPSGRVTEKTFKTVDSLFNELSEIIKKSITWTNYPEGPVHTSEILKRLLTEMEKKR